VQAPHWNRQINGAGNGTRTRDIKLGKLALYQLSYARSVGLGSPLSGLGKCSRPPCHRQVGRFRKYALALPIDRVILEGMSPPTSGSGNDKPSAFLYFFPEESVTRNELRSILEGADKERRAWAISHLLRYAQWEDIWTFVSEDQVREVFATLDLPENLQVAWARKLKIEAPAR
jgi:hypothetical protein